MPEIGEDVALAEAACVQLGSQPWHVFRGYHERFEELAVSRHLVQWRPVAVDGEAALLDKQPQVRLRTHDSADETGLGHLVVEGGRQQRPAQVAIDGRSYLGRA